jgi:hypothetical protein
MNEHESSTDIDQPKVGSIQKLPKDETAKSSETLSDQLTDDQLGAVSGGYLLGKKGGGVGPGGTGA